MTIGNADEIEKPKVVLFTENRISHVFLSVMYRMYIDEMDWPFDIVNKTHQCG